MPESSVFPPHDAAARAVAGGLRLVILGAVLALFQPPGAVAVEAATPALWQALGGGEHVALIRHALAPGNGDPPEFDVHECATQRNLSAAGRAQAARIGERFRANGIRTAAVFSSEWCRCMDTARALALGPVQPLPIANSFFRQYEREAEQTAALTGWVRAARLDQPVLVVTHQVNITALTGIYPASGEIVIVRRSPGGALEVVGTVKTD